MPFIKNISLKRRKTTTSSTSSIFLGEVSGTTHTFYISGSTQIFGWGRNTVGQIGDNTITNRCTPVSVAGTTKTFCQIRAGNSHTAAIDKNGRVWTWGNNFQGQLGDNSITSRRTPVSVAGTTKTFCQIMSGFSHTAAIDKNGRVWAWGSNASGQLGDNTVVSKITPISILGATKTFCKIGGTANYTVAIDKNGLVWAWGVNLVGQLGDNTITPRCTPVSVAGTTKTFCQITTGLGHTVAIDKNGTVWGWGRNDFGQLGDNTVISKRTPVSVAGTTKTFCQIGAGVSHTIAIDKNGRVWTWGLNSNGQLGDNSITNKCTPISVGGTTKTFCKITGGSCNTIAIDKDGRVWAWGFNNNGELGDNTTLSRLTPVRVYNL